MKKQLEENDREMEQMEKTYEEKLAAALAAAKNVFIICFLLCYFEIEF
jgi:hypothetical protein